MQEELLQFKLQEFWTLVYLLYGKRAIGSKWVYKNKLDERGIVIRNKARLDFVVYQLDVKSAFLYGKIKEEVYVCQHLGFKDPDFPYKVYKVGKALYGLHQAPRACIKRIGKGFSGKKTPLVPTMIRLCIRKEGDSLVRATTTASSLEAEQESGNISKTQTKATSNEPSSHGTSSDEGIEDVGEEDVFEVVTIAKMIIDTVVDVAQVTTGIADIPVSVVETIVTTALTITAKSTKTNV
nr:retrotransposon protein, putative, unclassified [Tanacetum cinerariifolium]